MTDFYKALQDLFPSVVRSFIDEPRLSSPPADADFPYVVLGGTEPNALSGPDRFRPTLSDKPSKVALDVRITYAGLTRESVRVMMRHVRTALGSPPVVEGYRCHLTRPVSLQPMTVDRDVSWGGLNPRYSQDELRLTAHLSGGSHAHQ